MYGNKFMDMWRGIDLNEVKACWAQELGAYKPSQIGAAVDALKGNTFPPTLPEFLELCEQSGKPQVTAAAHLPYRPRATVDPNDPEVVEARARCMASVSRGFERPSAAWAYRAKRRWLNNEIKYSPDVLSMINSAIERDNGHSDPFSVRCEVAA